MGPDSGTNRVIRGGRFAVAPMDGFTANRYRGSPSDGSGGFRVCRGVPIR